MRAWINGICDLVDQLTALHPEYQELMAQWEAILPRYQEILDSLPEADAEVLREFEYLSKEMDYQKMQTAYRVGCQQP